MKNSGQSSKRGFTLVEITIVVVTVGLLAALSVPAYMNVSRKSTLSSAENLLRQYASAASQYFMDHGVTSVDGSTLLEEGYFNVPKHRAFVKGEVGVITEGEPIVLTGLDIGDVTYNF